MAFDFRRELDRAQESVRRNPKVLIGIGVGAVVFIVFIVLNVFVFGSATKTISKQDAEVAQKLAEDAAKAQAEYDRDNPPPPPPPEIERGPAKPKS